MKFPTLHTPSSSCYFGLKVRAYEGVPAVAGSTSTGSRFSFHRTEYERTSSSNAASFSGFRLFVALV